MNYLVIRTGKIYDVSRRLYIENNPIDEIDEVLKKEDTCCFAKFGKKLGANTIKKYITKGPLKLVVVLNNGKAYKSKTYAIVQPLDEPPSNRKNIPKYYSGREDMVGTWIEISTTEAQVSLNDLFVVSSFERLLTSMSSSSSSFFFCKTNSR